MGKRGNSRGAKGLHCMRAQDMSVSYRLGIADYGSKMTHDVSELHQEIDESIEESRMREIRTYGSTRGNAGIGDDKRPAFSTLLFLVAQYIRTIQFSSNKLLFEI